MSTKILPTINRRPIRCKADNLYSHKCTVSIPMNAKHQPALSGTYVRPSPCYSCSGDMSNIVDAFIVATRFTNRAKELRAAPNPRPRPAQLHASTINNTGRFQAGDAPYLGEGAPATLPPISPKLPSPPTGTTPTPGQPSAHTADTEHIRLTFMIL